MKDFLKILIFIIFLAFIWLLFFYSAEIILSPNININKVCFKQECFLVELAITSAEREKGLMFRTELEKSKGMLFIFNKENIYPFWMKNTLIPLDIVWIGESNKVVFISENTQPCKSAECNLINPNVPAKYVLEINAGLVKKLNIKTEDNVSFKP